MFKKIKIIFFILSLFFLKVDTGYTSNYYLSVDNLEIENNSSLSRSQILDQIYVKGFNELISNIILSKDFKKAKSEATENLIKDMIYSFQVIYPNKEELDISEDKIKVNLKFNKLRVHDFLKKLNISYSSSSKTRINLIPIKIEKNSFFIFENNYFYNNWNKSLSKNNLIEFIVPNEDIDLIDFFKKNLENIDSLDLNDKSLTKELSNVAIILLEEQEAKLSVFLKLKILETKRNYSMKFNLSSSKNELDYDYIIKNLREFIYDSWKEINLVDLNIPSSLNLIFNNKNLNEISNLVNQLEEIDIIEKYDFLKINNNEVVLKVKFYGDIETLKNKLNEKNLNLLEKNFTWFIELI